MQHAVKSRVTRGALIVAFLATQPVAAQASSTPLPISPGAYSGIIDFQAADSLGPRFQTASGSAQGGGSGPIQFTATDSQVSGDFSLSTSFTAQAQTRGATGQGVLQVATTGTLAGSPTRMTFSGTSDMTGSMQIDENGLSFDQPVDVSNPIPGSGAQVQILSASCEEVDGSLAPPLTQSAIDNGLVVQQLTAQFVAFRNADRLPTATLQKVDALNQQALALQQKMASLSATDFLTQTGQLLHAANLLYYGIYDQLGDAGCDASGRWGSFLLPTVQLLFRLGLRPGVFSADQLHTLTVLGFESGYLQSDTVAEALPNLSAPVSDLNDPSQRMIFDLYWLHTDLEAQVNSAGGDVTVLREVYLTAQMVGFDDLVQQLGAGQ